MVRSLPNRRPKRSQSFLCNPPTQSGSASSGASIDLVEISLASISCWQKRPESALSYCSDWCLRPSRSLTSGTLLILFMPRPTQEKRKLRRVLMGAPPFRKYKSAKRDRDGLCRAGIQENRGTLVAE